MVDFTEYITRKDLKESRVSAAFAYPLFFAPLILAEDSQFGRFHANQSILNLVLSTVGAVVLSFIPYAGPFLMLIQEALCVVWAVRGFILALKGKAKGIPFVGWISILAYRYPEQTK